jgi:release factor glutamine methyltransferase
MTHLPPASPAPEVWTSRKILAWMQQAFAKAQLDSPRLLAEMLLAHVLGCERLKLYLDPDRPMSPLERSTLRDLTSRALRHEPVQYLVGEAWFFGLPFRSDKRALIPRPCTQELVAAVLQHQRAVHGPSDTAGPTRGSGMLIADICTGTGCVAIALAKNLPGTRVVATDISADALALAAENVQRHAVGDRLTLLQGDLLAPLANYPPTAGEGSLDCLAANPPYVPDHEWPDQVDRNVRDHEPHLALRAGPDGLQYLAPLIQHAPRLLKPGGLLALELAHAHAKQAQTLAHEHPLLEHARLITDEDGLLRVLAATRKR